MAPSPELAWIGVIGGIIGIVTSIINLVVLWRNRRRIEFRVISAKIYYEPWEKRDIVGIYWPGPPPGTTPSIKDGDSRRAFIVTEFVVENEYPTEVTVGRFLIDDWMFSNRYDTKGLLYPLKRDYRVFDLHSRTPISLENYAKIAPKGTYGLRLEVLEETDGPHWTSSKSRYVVILPKSYKVEFRTNVGLHRHKIRFGSPNGFRGLLSHVHHWSDLLPPSASTATSYALPLGVEYPQRRTPLRWRMRNWWVSTREWALYGKTYHLPDEPNRISRLFRRSKKPE